MTIVSRPMREIVEMEKGIIRTEDDITRLRFLDWGRTLHGPGHDMRNLKRWLNRNMRYTVIKTDMYAAPIYAGFPDWQHAGNHVSIGQFYWNWFHQQFQSIPQKEIFFSDSPDFCGSITFPSSREQAEHCTHFWGDIGIVSIAAFVQSLVQMRPGDLWITIRDASTQVILEARADFFTHTAKHLDDMTENRPALACAQSLLWN